MQNLLNLKRGLWTTEQQSSYFLFSPGKMFLTCFWFRSGLVALFLKMSERGDSWCTDSSFSSLLVKLSQVFESVLLTVFSSLQSSLLLVHIFPTQISSLQSTLLFNMLWYSTLWRAPPFSNDALWRTLFVEGCQDRLLTIAKSAVFPIIVFQRTRDIQNLYCMDDHLLKTQM